MENSQIKERPILFSGEMVRAIDDNWKTQTRRLIKLEEFRPCNDVPRSDWYFRVKKDGLWSNVSTARLIESKCPYGKPGDRLWVRETWAFARRVEPDYDTVFWDYEGLDWYPHDGEIEPGFKIVHKQTPYLNFYGKWNPSIFMPRWASRFLLEITEIRVEKVQDISLADINAEGTPYTLDTAKRPYGSRREQFQRLWDSINEKRGHSWEVNPWVWVIEFKKI